MLTGRQGATDAVFGSSSTGSASADAAAGGAAPSLAVLVADHTTESVADLGSDLVAPHDATWRARTRDVAVSDASRGSAAGNAVTLSTVRTRALLAAGPALTGSGSLTLEADQEAEARSRATLVALTFTDHRAVARSDRDVRMSGPVSVSARNRTTSTSVTNPAVDGPGVSPALVVALLRELADHVALSQSRRRHRQHLAARAGLGGRRLHRPQRRPPRRLGACCPTGSPSSAAGRSGCSPSPS